MIEVSETNGVALNETVGQPFRYYVDQEGVYLGATDGQPLSGFEVMGAPFSADQIWLFPGWAESASWAKMREDQWREEQMTRIANQLLMIEDEDPNVETGTARQWRDYRIELRKWVEGSADFPDKEKRPVAPSS